MLTEVSILMSEIYVFHQFSAVVVSQKVYCNVSRLQEVAMNQDQAFTNITKTLN